MGDLLCMDPKGIDLMKPMVNYGVDSLMAMEMVSWASNEMDVAVTQMDILSGITAEGVLERAPVRHRLPLQGAHNEIVPKHAPSLVNNL